MDAPDVPGIQLGQDLVQPAPRGGQDQLDGGPVLLGLLGDLGEVADGKPLPVQRQVIQRSPGSAGHMVGKLHLSTGDGAGLKGRGHFGKRDRTVGPSSRRGQALFGGFELPAGGAAARADLAAAAQRARSVSGQVTGHPGKVVVVGAAEPHRPRKCRSGRLGQVACEVQARLLGGVLVVERLDRIAASVNLRTQPRGLLAQGIGAVATVYLDVQQGQIPPAGRDANRRRIRAGRQVADHYSPQPRLYAHRAAALHAGAVPKNGHGRDRRIKTSALRHPALLFRRAFFHRAAPCPASIRPSRPPTR